MKDSSEICVYHEKFENDLRKSLGDIHSLPEACAFDRETLNEGAIVVMILEISYVRGQRSR